LTASKNEGKAKQKKEKKRVRTDLCKISACITDRFCVLEPFQMASFEKALNLHISGSGCLFNWGKQATGADRNLIGTPFGSFDSAV
jgi:hypothetical protein